MILYCLQIIFIPFDCLVQASCKIELRIISQQAFCFANVGITMLDIAWAVRAKVRFDIFTKCLGQRIVNVNQVLSATISHIKCLTACLVGSQASFEVGLNYILYVSEVATLFTVTVDSRLFIVQELLDELWDNRSIRPMWILTTAKHIKVAQTDVFQTIVSMILFTPLFIATLAE